MRSLPLIPLRSSRAGVLTLLFAVLAIVSLGCSNAETLPTLAPVKGKATIDGAPLTAGQVSLQAEAADPAAKIPPSSGTIDGNGNYEIFTGGKPGAPLGKYKVVVTPSMVPMQDGGTPSAQPNLKFRMSADTPLRIEVVESPKEGQYDLVTTK